jgi:hypothetical protein
VIENLTPCADVKGVKRMTDFMMESSGGMMVAMGAFCVLILALLLLSVAALVKYLSGSRQNKKHVENSDAEHGL